MALVREAARKRGISFLPIPPYSPHLNMVEGAVNHFKQVVVTVLFSACSVDGPITTRHVWHVAEFVCYTHEHFMKLRRFDTYRGSSTAWVPPWTLNIGTAPRYKRGHRRDRRRRGERSTRRSAH
jgi:hypothetical protein